MNTDILLIGAGFAGHVAKEYYGDRAILTELKSVDYDDWVKVFKRHQPRYVLNMAAKTNTAKIENDDAYANEAWIANVQLPVMLAKLATDRGARFGSFSTAMGYHDPKGTKLFVETDPIVEFGQMCRYARQKWEGEKAISNAKDVDQSKVTIFRIHQPFSWYPHPANLLTKLLSRPNLLNEHSSFTCLDDAMPIIDTLLRSEDQSGLFHLANWGTTTHLAIGNKLKSAGLIPSDVELKELSRLELDKMTREKKGAYQPRVIFQTQRLQKLNLQMPKIDVSLNRAIADMAASQTVGVR